MAYSEFPKILQQETTPLNSCLNLMRVQCPLKKIMEPEAVLPPPQPLFTTCPEITSPPFPSVFVVIVTPTLSVLSTDALVTRIHASVQQNCIRY